MHLSKSSCRRISALIFVATTLLTTVILSNLEYNQLISLTGAIFIGIITSAIWTEVSYRFLVKQATAPLDELIEKI